ncbi:hypothetical protein GRS48_10770 [Halorubrum sp. JWXQ-INN 858]|uniref:NAD(P)-binding protein n=1 Tax=Halorubrum sp. JWXQ-INN 858 TaxID=2690782 RepID=UPI0013569AC4|nr:NAD(P)-binding protein [Halorubrum sp. JWXQ-INN 858]MWV65297.1 hypothetical protein [Halorubrum sp. JWXQ-INN 858]
MDRSDGPIDPDVIVLGSGSLTAPILEALGGDRTAVIVSTASEALAFEREGVVVITGDPSDDATLERAGIESCDVVLVATDDDRTDALTILTARSGNPSARIVAAATNRENVRKLERAGADAVISPASIGGGILVDSALSTAGNRSRRGRGGTSGSNEKDGKNEENRD